MTDWSPNGGTVAGVEAGADVELGKWDLLARIGLTLSSLEKKEKDRSAQEARRLALLPVHRPKMANGAAVTATNLILNLGTPKRGWYWVVRAIAVGGTAVTDTPAGTAYVLATPGGPVNPQPLSMLNLRDFTTGAFPQTAFYGRRELIVEDGEYLLVVITGGTNTVNYSAFAQVDEFQTVVDIPSTSDVR